MKNIFIFILGTSDFIQKRICCTKPLAGNYLKKISTLFFLCFLFSFLLIFPAQSLEASKEALLLWFDTLMPTLLPFLILSQLILKTSIINIVQKISGPVFRKIFHCSDNGAFCMLCGFLCGYPVGARLIALQLKEENLSITEGQYLLSFCNNVSPMFCISYGITCAIGSRQILPYLFILYGSALLFGFLTRPEGQPVKSILAKKQTPTAENIFQLIDVCIIDSFYIMIKLCGYLMLFSIISAGLLMLVPDDMLYAPSIITSFLELTGGLSLASKLPKGILRSAISVAALTFGGMCCIFQTNSVIADTGLSLKKYILDKAIISVISLCLFFLWLFFCLAVNGRC